MAQKKKHDSHVRPSERKVEKGEESPQVILFWVNIEK